MTETRIIRDKKGRTIDCVVDVCFDFGGKPIAALTPVDLPVELVWHNPVRIIPEWWEHPEKLLALDDELAKTGLTLVRSAAFLTVKNTRPDVVPPGADKDEPERMIYEEDDIYEKIIGVSGVYGLWTPVDPPVLVAMLDDQGGILLDDVELGALGLASRIKVWAGDVPQ